MKYAIVGTGSRHQLYRQALAETYRSGNPLVGLCDNNDQRLALSAQAFDAGGNGIPTYDASEFGQMLREQRPDTVIVTVPDDLHHEYIAAALRAGSNVMTEKPMTIDLARLKVILDAQAETGRHITVTFNYRYTPARTQLKDILMSGVVGKVTGVHFRWCLDRVHGADYFRRWHRYKDRSGGLLVHKATHHFDLVNWWLGASPVSVSARGSRDFYTPEMAAELGLQDHGPRCHGCPVAERCGYRLDLENDPDLKALFLDTEDSDGYLRDRCLFDDDITIEDSMQVQVGYENGASMSYSLNAYSPWEGLEISFTGTKGELRHRHVEVHGVFGGKRDKANGSESMTTTLQLAGQKPQDIEVWAGEGEHGGADPVMLSYLFDPTAEPDRYGRSSSYLDGALSILTGIAANTSIATGQTVDIATLLAEHDIKLPKKTWL
ncbi:MAG: Gfo/Idh/MocA family oxidoreductase [Maritimibacter sp.]